MAGTKAPTAMSILPQTQSKSGFGLQSVSLNRGGVKMMMSNNSQIGNSYFNAQKNIGSLGAGSRSSASYATMMISMGGLPDG